MTTPGPLDRSTDSSPRPKRSDAKRNEQALLDAAAAVFVTEGVDAPVRLIAERAGVGMGTIYRHFPTRPALVAAVYQHQVEALAEAGPALLRELGDPAVALQRWAAGFVEFLVTKHGLAGALGSDAQGVNTLHQYFVDRLVPVCDDLLDAALGPDTSGQVSGYMLMRGIGNLCIVGDNDSRYDAARLVALLVAGVLTGERHDRDPEPD
ncbi:TetR/AcrR family transcriptional regulator [Myceligenerans salitolerans]|uniref:TetR/AcrR family transcriptional regulator n=1 Tax=Myceligenerans salitolerans TaxID=1230528 RepID=A0ABS3I4C5_9MICO|nr:TetR/AcrR family transcriptional regulator [Myceligenerans salitolerans]MBO0607839.1 TetR/AcrR family transcriptional regulator [Myceligenerans salitolerans]